MTKVIITGQNHAPLVSRKPVNGADAAVVEEGERGVQEGLLAFSKTTTRTD